MSFVYAVAVGLGVATTAVIARRIGEHNNHKASEAAFQAIVTGILISGFIAVIGLFFAEDLLKIMGADDNVIKIGKSYTSVMFSGNIVIMLLFIINAIFRSSGDAAVSMKVLWLANILNIILDPLLIFGLGPFPALGVKGAAIATNIGRGVAVIYQLYILFYGSKRIQIKKKDLQLNFPIIKKLLNLSKGSIFQNIIGTASWIGLVRIISEFGSQAVAGYTIAIRIILFVLLPAWGLSNAAGTLVGQNLGAGQIKRAVKSVWITGYSNLIFMFVINSILILFPESFIKLFIDDPESVKIGVSALEYMCFGFIVYALGMVTAQAINGAGDTNTPLWINIISFWGIELPFAYLFSFFTDLNEKGVFVSIIFSTLTFTFLSTFFFVRGKWKLKQV
jgi:putative MATE family efflux protein